jgi:23S rRNA A2030 N6-methylase RlmJ
VAALTDGELHLRLAFARAVEEWRRGIERAKTSEDLQLIVAAFLEYATEIRLSSLSSVPAELERASERLRRLSARAGR